jgi:hypothetical protein
MTNKSGWGIGIAMTILAFLIGIPGIFLLIGIGEAANNALVPFLVLAVAFALLAGFLAWVAPRAWWAIALAMSAPVAVIALLGSWSGSALLLGGIFIVAVTLGAAYLGKWLRERRQAKQPPPAG